MATERAQAMARAAYETWRGCAVVPLPEWDALDDPAQSRWVKIVIRAVAAGREHDQVAPLRVVPLVTPQDEGEHP